MAVSQNFSRKLLPFGPGPIILIGIAIFIFRLFTGFSKFHSHDEFQIYLIGLQSYTTGIYPYFGPDIVYTNSQIPGGLQGLLISLPIYCLKIPEAPFILLNLLTFTVLIFFGWYLSRRIQNVPPWFIFLLLLTLPWSIHYSTHIENPSYVLVGSVLFFIAILELGGIYETRLINYKLSFAFIGFSIFWIMQLHLSWILTIPYLLWICWINRKDAKLLLKGFMFFIMGAILPLSALIPTLIKGFATGGTESNIVFNPGNILEIPNILLRFLSYASYETPRFLGHGLERQLDFLSRYFWVIPFALLLLIIGWLQVLYFILSFFRKNDLKEWKKIKWFVAGSLALLSFSFMFSITEPRSHTFYILYPVAILYSFYCYGRLFKHRIKILAIIVILSGIVFQGSLIIDRFNNRSVFAYRDAVQISIDELDYTLLGVRRESQIIKANRESFWQPSEVNSKMIFYTGFESKKPYFKPQNIVGNVKYEGEYSCKVDSVQSYSYALILPVNALKHRNKAIASFWTKTDQMDCFLLVYEVRSDTGNCWNSKKLTTSTNNDAEWKFIQIEFDLPYYMSYESEIQIYVWMNRKEASRMYIDNFAVEFSHE